MSELVVKNKEVVVPGQLLATGMDYLPGTGAYRWKDQIRANRIGLVSLDGRAVRLIPLSGKYSPKRDDVIVGKVIDILMSGWRIDTNSAYSAMLPVKEASDSFIERDHDLSTIFGIGDYLVCRVTGVTSQKLIDVSVRGPGLGRLEAGNMIQANPYKVPRVIGKQGSMVSLIKNATGCNIIVGQNGVIWVQGSPQGEVIAVRTIKLIERLAHVSGLTDMIKLYLEDQTKGLDLPAAPEREDPGAFRRTEQRRYDGPRRQNGRDNRNNRRFGSHRRGGSNE